MYSYACVPTVRETVYGGDTTGSLHEISQVRRNACILRLVLDSVEIYN